MTVKATEKAPDDTASSACRNCEGKGRVNDVRTAAVTHRATTIRRKCRVCGGSGKQPEPQTVPTKPASGDIPDWMLGLD